jgi:PAS domain S-box-containing protein
MDDYRVLFDANPRPAFVSDRETLRFLAVNQAACDLYGWTEEEMLAMTLRDVRPSEEMPTFEAAFSDPTKAAAPRYLRMGRHRRKDGEVLDVRLEIPA